MTAVVPRALRLAALGLVVMGAQGCGQQGPLVLREDARPIERADPAPSATEPGDEEDRDER